jgi:hypothetical protein
MAVNNHPAFGDCFEELWFWQTTVIVEIEKPERLKQQWIGADFGGDFEVKFPFEFAFEAE